jgi:hypothetical protein
MNQSGLFDFFSKIPPEEFHARWRKRKLDNEERDREEYAERKKRGDAEVLHKKARRQEQNRIAQGRRREKLKNMAKISLKGNTKQDSSVCLSFCVQLYQQYTHNF